MLASVHRIYFRVFASPEDEHVCSELQVKLRHIYFNVTIHDVSINQILTAYVCTCTCMYLKLSLKIGI